MGRKKAGGGKRRAVSGREDAAEAGLGYGIRVSVIWPNRQPLTANRFHLLYLHTRAGYRTWRRISRARTGRKDCHRPSRQKGSGPGGRKEERRELEGPAVPTIESAESLDDFGLGAAGLGVGEDALQAGLGLLEGGQHLAPEERDE